MMLRYKEMGEVRIKALQSLLEEKSFEYDSNAFNSAIMKLSNVTTFCVKTVELLYSKGILTKEDIASLIGGFEDEDSLEIID